MRKLWSAANIKVYGGGVAEAEFLGELAQLVGEYRYSNTTRSSSRQGISTSHDHDRKERTLDVSDLAAFPRGRAIMFASGAPAALLETVPWMNGPPLRRCGPPSQPTTPPTSPQLLKATGGQPLERRMSEGLGEWDDEPEAPEPVEDAPELFYANVAEFVAKKLAVTYRRQINVQGGSTWCPQWWKHAEAISRLEALWRAWEHLRLDGTTGISVWWRDHADHHMSVLLSADGPFRGCSPDDGHRAKLTPLPCDEPPGGLF